MKNSDFLLPLFAAAALLTGCGGSSGGSLQPADPPMMDEPPQLPGSALLILSSDLEDDSPIFILSSVEASNPGEATGSVAITGLADNDILVGMDFRPATGDLYAVGRLGNLYVINPHTAVVETTVALVAAPDSTPTFEALDGTHFGVDFNPVPDRLRVTSDTGQNLRINVDNGATLVDGPLDSGSGETRITGSAYTNSFAGTTSTRLFNIDTGEQMLYLQDPPNDGTLVNGVTLGIDADDANGFVIDGRNNAAIAALTVNGQPGLYRIDLTAEADVASLIGTLNIPGTLLGIALAPPAPPVVIGLTRDNALIEFAPGSPGMVSAPVTVTGLMEDGETLVGVDVRPATGELYGVSNLGNLYTVDAHSGVASFQAALVAAPDSGFDGLLGDDFAMDFNPVPDRLRLISDQGQNLRINVDNGETIVDGDIAYAEESDLGGIEDIPLLGPLLGLIGSILLPEDDAAVPALTAAAYTNSFAGTATTQLFTLDTGNDSLNLQNPPNDGTQVPLTDTPIAISGDQGFDIIGGDNGLVLAALSGNGMGPYTLYSINLMTGAFTERGQIGGADGPALRGITLQLR
ncbi:DUF4394 domain-containing protein [Isoalcanivorax indicus]|uniref:DUF4394 domain-containing protein n=1 Tax=Isoalcanivorax indicus TaxID=2202653 RepID=UPI0013C40356|nr:DUF4394 domain-containing protein [Isoalcanivorax indicus]